MKVLQNEIKIKTCKTPHPCNKTIYSSIIIKFKYKTYIIKLIAMTTLYFLTANYNNVILIMFCMQFYFSRAREIE